MFEVDEARYLHLCVNQTFIGVLCTLRIESTGEWCLSDEAEAKLDPDLNDPYVQCYEVSFLLAPDEYVPF